MLRWLVAINLIDGYHMALSGRPTNYDMIRTELRGARELDMKDPRGVPGSCRRRSLEILAWTDMENGYIIDCCTISNCQSPVTIKESNTLQVDSFRNVVNSEPLARIRKVLN